MKNHLNDAPVPMTRERAEELYSGWWDDSKRNRTRYEAAEHMTIDDRADALDTVFAAHDLREERDRLREKLVIAEKTNAGFEAALEAAEQERDENLAAYMKLADDVCTMLVEFDEPKSGSATAQAVDCAKRVVAELTAARDRIAALEEKLQEIQNKALEVAANYDAWFDRKDLIGNSVREELKAHFALLASPTSGPGWRARVKAEGAQEVLEEQWRDTSVKQPHENEIVLVHGGIAQYRDGKFYTGMETPQFTRPIVWEVKHWLPFPLPPSAGPSLSSAERQLAAKEGGEA